MLDMVQSPEHLRVFCPVSRHVEGANDNDSVKFNLGGVGDMLARLNHA